MQRAKLTIIGAGNVGASCAIWAAAKELGDIVLIDIPDFADKTAGKALDLAQCGPVERFEVDGGVGVARRGVSRRPPQPETDLVAGRGAQVFRWHDVMSRRVPAQHGRRA